MSTSAWWQASSRETDRALEGVAQRPRGVRGGLRPALAIDATYAGATGFADGYRETLIVDASTGVIAKMVGGTAGKAPDVTVDYDVRRATAADVLHGRANVHRTTITHRVS